MNTLSQTYHLSSRIQLEELTPQHLAIVKRIKSRIIQKDALKIIAIAEQIKAQDPHIKVSLMCNNNICSKSLKVLAEYGIDVRY